MATQNSINNTSNPITSTAVTVDPGSSGDAVINFNTNSAQRFQVGVDDSASDSFVIAPTTLGTSNMMSITTAGERTFPSTPAFLGFLGSGGTNVTGNGTTFTLGSGTALTEVFDQGSDFVTSGTFTAPVTGKYLLHAAGRFVGNTVATTLQTNLITSNRTYEGFYGRGASSIQLGVVFAVLADMDAADTFTVTDVVSGEAAQTSDASVNATDPRNYMAGNLTV